MMDEKQFFIDLINAIPENTYWSFQSASSEVYAALNGIQIISEAATHGLHFKNEFRQQIADLVKDDLFEGINFLEVVKEGEKLLEAFDGFVIVTISKNFDIKETALPKYLNMDLLYVADNW
jgi:hypothetical protein